jgi:hypothetical protein
MELSRKRKAALLMNGFFYSHGILNSRTYACIPDVLVELPLAHLFFPDDDIFSLIHTLALCTT